MNKPTETNILTDKQLSLQYSLKKMPLTNIYGLLTSNFKWTVEKALSVERSYKTFLWMSIYFGNNFSPNRDIIMLWQTHISDKTLYKYHCKYVFDGVEIYPNLNLQEIRYNHEETRKIFNQYRHLFNADPMSID